MPARAEWGAWLPPTSGLDEPPHWGVWEKARQGARSQAAMRAQLGCQWRPHESLCFQPPPPCPLNTHNFYGGHTGSSSTLLLPDRVEIPPLTHNNKSPSPTHCHQRPAPGNNEQLYPTFAPGVVFKHSQLKEKFK